MKVDTVFIILPAKATLPSQPVLTQYVTVSRMPVTLCLREQVTPSNRRGGRQKAGKLQLAHTRYLKVKPKALTLSWIYFGNDCSGILKRGDHYPLSYHKRLQWHPTQQQCHSLFQALQEQNPVYNLKCKHSSSPAQQLPL